MEHSEQPQFESMDEMAAATANNLAKAAAGSAYALFSDKKFRRLARFDTLPVAEHDRIFNELLVAGLTLQMLLLETPDLRVPIEMRPFLKQVADAIPAAHVRELAALGVEAEHHQTWHQLIRMRYEEYANDRHQARSASMQIEAAKAPLDRQSLAFIQATLPVQVVAIGCHQHNCRGKTDGYDDLLRLTLRHLSRFYIELRVRLEGGRITPLDRARVAAKRLLRRGRRH